MSVLGDRIRQERESRGWSQVYVSERLGMKRSSTYANWEYGLRDPDTEMLAKLAELFDVTTDYLTGRTNIKRELILPDSVNLHILKEIADKYNVDLTDEENRRKMEDIIKLVFADYKRQQNK